MRAQRNEEIRKYAADRRVYLYELSEALGICYSSLYNLLNRNLTDAKRAEIMRTIDELAAARK